MKNVTLNQIASVAGAAFLGLGKRLEPYGANWSYSEELFACLQAKKLILKWKKEVPSKLEGRIKFLVSKTLKNKMSSPTKDNSFVIVQKGEFKTIRKSFDRGTNAGGNGVFVEWENGKAFLIKDSVKHEASMGFPYSGGYKKYPLNCLKILLPLARITFLLKLFLFGLYVLNIFQSSFCFNINID